MIRALKWIGIALLAALAGIAIWGWAPDIPAATLRERHGQPPSQFVDIGDGLAMHVRDEGPRDAPVIVLLHGSNASLHSWDGWVEQLKTGYRVIRIDQIGHGLTGPNPAGDYRPQAFVDTLDRTLGAMGVERFALAGNSMGGSVAWRYALAHPGKLSALILIDGGGAPGVAPTSTPVGFRLARIAALRPVMQTITPRGVIERSLEQSVGNPAIVDDAMVDRYWELLRHPGNRAATAARFALPRAEASIAEMQRISTPTLVIWGEQDGLIPVAAGRWFARHIRGAELIVYPDLGHIPMEEDPARTAADAADWLQRQR